MTKDDIIRMAREAGLRRFGPLNIDCELERFANLVADAERKAMTERIRTIIVQAEERGASAEREAAEERVTNLFADMEIPYLPDIAAAIRARSNV